MAPPVIQNPRHMADLSRQLRAAQDEIIILGAVIGPAKSPGLSGQHRTHAEQMADVIVAPQQIQVEIRFEMRLEMLFSLEIHLVLIAVHRIQRRILPKRLRQLIQGIRCQQVVVIQQADKFAPGHLQRRVGVAGNASVGRKLFIAHPIIVPGILPDHGFRCRVLPAAVRQAKFQMGITLVQHRLDHFPQEPLRRPVNGHQHRDQRPVLCFAFFSLPLPFSLRRQMGRKPAFIASLCLSDFLMLQRLSHQTSGAVFFSICGCARDQILPFHNQKVTSPS